MRLLPLLPLLLLLTACERDPSDVPEPLREVTEVHRDLVPEAVDILIVVDDTRSMVPVQDVLAASMSSLTRWLIPPMDWHVGVLTAEVVSFARSGRLLPWGAKRWVDRDVRNPESAIGEMLTVAAREDGSSEPRHAVQLALTEPLVSTVNGGFRRGRSPLHLLVVSDAADASSEPDVPGLVALLEDAAGPAPLTVNVLGPGAEGCGDPGDAAAHEALRAAVGGLWGDACADDHGPFLDAMGEALHGVRGVYGLAEPPVDGTLEVIVVDGTFRTPALATGEACEEEPCWTYTVVVDPPTITLDPAPPPGAEVEVTYLPDRG